ncbi:hypothetical protein XA68_15194 [Ophiocordyceps unilateralis]|uniref:Uncharacterized protein n=1 Tax=Ophiocordyceps unilateralis TaxID=268505 RepID=A0A2A9P8Y6_OPHUN|nr:hypothetical protein XA68_15194 [Ophiocordyceps unilateralis]
MAQFIGSSSSISVRHRHRHRHRHRRRHTLPVPVPVPLSSLSLLLLAVNLTCLFSLSSAIHTYSSPPSDYRPDHPFQHLLESHAQPPPNSPPPTASAALKHVPDGPPLEPRRQGELQLDATSIGIQKPAPDAAVAQAVVGRAPDEARCHPPAHYDGIVSRSHHFGHRRSRLGAPTAAAHGRQHNPLRCLDRRLEQRRVHIEVPVQDVHLRQPVARVPFRHVKVPSVERPARRVVEMRLRVYKHAQVSLLLGLEGVERVGVGLGGEARRADAVVEHNHDASPPSQHTGRQLDGA